MNHFVTFISDAAKNVIEYNQLPEIKFNATKTTKMENPKRSRWAQKQDHGGKKVAFTDIFKRKGWKRNDTFVSMETVVPKPNHYKERHATVETE